MPLLNANNKRNYNLERKLWHNKGNTFSIGCAGCPERSICGGLQVSAPIFSCEDYCCQEPENCDVVCRNNPEDFVNRIREINGFDLMTVDHAPKLAVPVLPSVIPLLYHRGGRSDTLSIEAVSLQFFQMFNHETGKLQFDTHEELCKAYRISPNTRIILSGTEVDKPLECWWSFSLKRREIIKELKKLNIDLVTTPNYSVFSDQPRWDDLHSMKRIALIWQEFMEEGLPAALHVNARTDIDWQRWVDFICYRPEVGNIAFEFGTGAGWMKRREWYAGKLSNLAESVGRPLHLTVRGGASILPMIADSFESISFLDTSAFMKTVKRRRAILKGRKLEWESCPTNKDAPLDFLMKHNIQVTSQWVQGMTRLV